jgi:uncharacterized protein
MTTARYDGFLPGRYPIDAAGNGGFRFADMSHRGSLLVLASGIRAWPVTSIADVTPNILGPVFEEAASIDLLLIGTGLQPAFIDDAIRWRIREHSITMDAMTTMAAAKTYNILLGEGRRVAAALIAV